MWSRRTMRRLGATVAFAVAVLAAAAEAAAPAGEQVRLDAFTATAHQVSNLRSRGAEPVCQLPLARWEPHRPDANRFPDQVLGEPVRDGSGARWLRADAWPQVAPLLADRLRLCREKGFDLVDGGGYPPGESGSSQFASGVAGLAGEFGLTITG